MIKATAVQSYGPIRDRLHEIVFEADTPAGTAFDVVLILSILTNVLVVMLDSVAETLRTTIIVPSADC